MTRRPLLLSILLLAFATLLARPAWAQSIAPSSSVRGLLVVAHASVRKLDLATVKRIFMGKTVEIDGLRVVPVNLAAGPARQRFFTDFLDTTEDDYVGYWTVRRYVGKGTPPLELRQPAEVIDYINRTPGAIGYLEEGEVPRGVNVVLRR